MGWRVSILVGWLDGARRFWSELPEHLADAKQRIADDPWAILQFTAVRVALITVAVVVVVHE